MTTESAVPLRGIAGFVLTIRFLTELALFAGLAVAGARLAGTVLFSILGGVLAPVVAVTIWGLGIVLAVAGIGFAALTRVYAKDC